MRFWFCLSLMVLSSGSHLAEAEELRIAAAASLHHALPKIAEAFERDTGHHPKLIFGSSGNLARQILQGAPFELFLSANEEYAELLAKSGVTEDQGTVYALGRLVLFIPTGSRVESSPDLSGLLNSLSDGRLKRIAIANPQHAPYGMAARKALQGAAAWKTLVPRMVMGENVAQATQFALSGSVDAALISLSNVLLPDIKKRGTHIIVDDRLYPALRQRMVLIKGSTTVARAFYTFMQTPKTREILMRFGFRLPAHVTVPEVGH